MLSSPPPETGDDTEPMPSLSVLRTLAREFVTRERSPRVTEPDLVMDDPDKVAAYTHAGREDEVMAPVYLFHAAQISEVVRAGDTVIDLGCGPATQLAMVARLNPDSHFIGLDLSDEMLQQARTHIAEQGLQNVEFRETDITDLSAFEDSSVDAAMSTMVLHHLPDVAALERTFAEVSRVVKPDGGLYLVDFGHLKSEKSINYFAYQYADRQPELFTLDYLYSLRAAFDREDFERLAETYLRDRAKFYSTFIMPFMVAVKSAPRAENTAQLRGQLKQLKQALPDHHKTDLADLKTFFALGGLKSPLL